MLREEVVFEKLPDVRFFDLYENQKANLRDYQHNCKDKLDNLANFGFYCIDCRLSYCTVCDTEKHGDHDTIKKSQYEMDSGVIENIFKDTETEIDTYKTLQNPNELQNKMRQNLDDQINSLHQKLEDFKQKKIEEINSYAVFPPISDALHKEIDKLKTELKNFFRRHKKFFNSERFNNDQENAIFLLSFDLINSIKNKNIELSEIMIKAQNHASDLEDNMKCKTEEFSKSVDQLIDQVANAEFEHGVKEIVDVISQLRDQDNYGEVKSKMSKYDKHIEYFKEVVFNHIKTLGNIREFEKHINYCDKMARKAAFNPFGEPESSIMANNSFQDLLVENQDDSSLDQNKIVELAEKDVKQRASRKSIDDINKYSSNNRNGTASPNKMHKSSSMNRAASVKKLERHPSTDSLVPETESIAKIDFNAADYKNKNDVILENRIIQRFYSYEFLELIEKEFKVKDHRFDISVAILEAIPELANELDEDDVCKPIVGTNEIQIYDRKKRYIFKQEVKLDKKKHGYIRFHPGVRYLLVEDKLYISGGRDDTTDYKVVLSFDIKTFVLKRLSDLNTARSYHSMKYFESTKTLIAIGGQKNAACEMYDVKLNKWKMLPPLNIPRANVFIFNDGAGSIYAFFGMEGDISKSEDFSDVVEVLKIKSLKPKWLKIDYINRSKLIFKKTYLEILPLSDDKLLIYGGKNMLPDKKYFAIFLLKRNEVFKVDKRILDYLRLEDKSKK